MLSKAVNICNSQDVLANGKNIIYTGMQVKGAYLITLISGTFQISFKYFSISSYLDKG